MKRLGRNFQERELRRSDRLLMRKFSQYLIPTMITYAALSLNEFVDSMLVSNLLDSDAMAIVNIGTPVVLVMAAAYALLGNGGATLYAMALGRRDHEAAGRSLTAAAVASLILGLLIMIPGLLLHEPLAVLLCRDEALRATFDHYLIVLLLSAPLEVLILTIASFLPSAGYPGLTTTVNVIANVVNISMDYVYIHFFHMGVDGAAWATLTGYIVAAAFMGFYAMRGKVRLFISKNVKESMKSIGEIAGLGRPDATNQIGLSLQFAFCNRLAMAAAGKNGMIAFSLCNQATSVMTIFIGAVIGTGITMLAVLHGQSDFKGEEDTLKMSMIAQFVMSVLGTLLFWIFAPEIAALYNIKKGAQFTMAVYAFRIYSLMFIPRDAVIVYYRYLKIIGLTHYSTVMSALDSFAAIIPMAWIMVGLLGINGLWFAFPLTEVLLVVGMLIANRYFVAKSGGRLRGPLMIECEIEGDPKTVMDASISKESEDIAFISERLQRICEENGLSKINSMKVAMSVEEIAVYTANRKSEDSYADVLVKIRNGDVEIDFRTLGEVFDPHADYDGDIRENVQILRGIVSAISNDYILGMNSTRITIKGDTANAS